MRKRILYLALFLAAGGAAIGVMSHARGTAATPAAAAATDPDAICAAGKVEPVSEEVKIGSQVSGVLREVPVSEGQRVPKGGVIAVLENGDYAARVSEAQATLAIRQAELDRVVNGAREQERREAAASVDEERAVLANARAEMERRRSLFDSGDISRSDWERAQREYQVAEARVNAAAQHSSFVDAPARNDEKVRAEASVELARRNWLRRGPCWRRPWCALPSRVPF
jgi:multidrug resistance efflux pump